VIVAIGVTRENRTGFLDCNHSLGRITPCKDTQGAIRTCRENLIRVFFFWVFSGKDLWKTLSRDSTQEVW